MLICELVVENMEFSKKLSLSFIYGGATEARFKVFQRTPEHLWLRGGKILFTEHFEQSYIIG